MSRRGVAGERVDWPLPAFLFCCLLLLPGSPGGSGRVFLPVVFLFVRCVKGRFFLFAGGQASPLQSFRLPRRNNRSQTDVSN